DNIAHDAHLWGAVYGIVFMVVLAALFSPNLLRFFIDQLLQGPSMPNF
ncbi:MAG: rhomboid family intramembrane serine protease, partial [Phaeodactylibacter sp.]|nr:rhomboid family intramembrane serine protease [Phaeodactylibacter sp.]